MDSKLVYTFNADRMKRIIQLLDKEWAQIQAKLPKAIEIKNSLIIISKTSVSFTGGPHSKLDTALVCLKDANEVNCEAVYALGQAYANLACREKHPKAPLEIEACKYGKFYADDAALRLYAAAEHVANFIVAFMHIEQDELKPYKKNEHSSLAATVGKYIIDKKPDDEITSIIQKLINDNNYCNAISYRNEWVHEQPPLIEGLGIIYERKGSWEKKDDGYYELGLRGGDTPDYTVDSLVDMVSSASHAFTKTLSELSDIFITRLKKLGMKFETIKNGSNPSLTK